MKHSTGISLGLIKFSLGRPILVPRWISSMSCRIRSRIELDKATFLKARTIMSELPLRSDSSNYTRQPSFQGMLWLGFLFVCFYLIVCLSFFVWFESFSEIFSLFPSRTLFYVTWSHYFVSSYPGHREVALSKDIFIPSQLAIVSPFQSSFL